MTFASVINAASGAGAPATPTDILYAYRDNNSSARSSTTTLQDDNTLRFDVEANKWYAYETYIRSDVSSTTSPPSIKIDHRKPVGSPPATYSGSVMYYTVGEGGDNPGGLTALNWVGQVGAGGWISTFTVVGSGENNVADQAAITGHGTFKTTQPGEFVLRWAPSISTSVTLRLELGSWIRMTPLE